VKSIWKLFPHGQCKIRATLGRVLDCEALDVPGSTPLDAWEHGGVKGPESLQEDSE